MESESDSESFNYVIFHKNCMDGFAGFIVLSNSGYIDNNASIYPDVPSANNPPPNVTGKNVIIIDVAYKKHVLEQIFDKAQRVVFIDHHQTIRNDVLELATIYGDRHQVVYDVSMSGASLTWKYFNPKKKVPLFIRYIEDNDTGAWIHEPTMNFILGLQVNYRMDLSRKNIKHWNRLSDPREVKRLIELGKKYSERKC